jgi:hypothetical protein
LTVPPALLSHESTEHYTPQYILDAVIACMGAIDLDPASNSSEIPNVPAARHYTAQDNGLVQPWVGRVLSPILNNERLFDLTVFHNGYLPSGSRHDKPDCICHLSNSCNRRVPCPVPIGDFQHQVVNNKMPHSDHYSFQILSPRFLFFH